MTQHFAKGLFKTLWILRDYLPEIVVGGGWAPFLYYRYLLEDTDRDPIFTRDIDLLVKLKVPVIGSRTIDQLLEKEGFKAVFKSRDKPPVIHYGGEFEGEPVEIEFLTDQVGSDSDLVKKVQPDLHAEALRFISIVIENTIELMISGKDLPGLSGQLSVKVPTPAAYIFHKGLVYRRRQDSRKGDKDLYYIFDLLTGCRKLMPSVMDDFAGLAQRYTPWFKAFIKNLETDFADPASEGVLRVLAQRPAGAFMDLDDDQFRYFVTGTFLSINRDLIEFLPA
jgi:hypothetical protein